MQSEDIKCQGHSSVLRFGEEEFSQRVLRRARLEASSDVSSPGPTNFKEQKFKGNEISPDSLS